MANVALLRDRSVVLACDPVNENLAAPQNISFAKNSFAGVRRLVLYAALGMSDAVAISFAFVAANFIRFGDPLHRFNWPGLLIALTLFAVVAAHNGSYSLDVLKFPKLGIKRTLRALVMALLFMAVLLFSLKLGASFSRISIGAGSVGALIVLAVSRWATGTAIGRHFQWQFTSEVLLIDAVPVVAERGQIVVCADKLGLYPSSSEPLLLERIGKLLKGCDRVVLACQPARRVSWVSMLKGAGIDVEVLMPELDELGILGVGQSGGSSTILVSRAALPLRHRIVKRLFDLAIVSPAIVLLIPLFIAIAAAIKLDSPGPVFFRQVRTGRGNRTFYMLKFRSMRVAELDLTASLLTQVRDPRVTRVGDFLRRTSLDELPQLINVLVGDMSIAGPRPHAPGALAGDALYWEVDERYWDRHAVKPGITGLAQVRGFRGTTFQYSDLTKRLQADLEYLSGWSLWRDVRIVLSTFRVLVHRNAF